MCHDSLEGRGVNTRSVYVAATRRVRSMLAKIAILERLEHSRIAPVRHLRTLLAVYDATDLARLDLPWWTYAATAEVDRFLRTRPAARVAEYGSGASTVWLARRAGRVDSIEHDTNFAGEVRDLIQAESNVTIHVVAAPEAALGSGVVESERDGEQGRDFGGYVRAIRTLEGPFDLIVIDGRARLACLEEAVDHLADGGLIVFDDARRRRYADLYSLPGLTIRVIRGAKPCLPYRDATALIQLKSS